MDGVIYAGSRALGVNELMVSLVKAVCGDVPKGVGWV